MPSAVSKILLTGLPGCGKTTAVMRICAALKDMRLAGFYTEEIRHNESRMGFRWRRLDGAEGTLAHVDIKSKSAGADKFKVGRYGVDVAGFERDVVPILDEAGTNVQLFVIDEIGKMECFSQKFVDAVRRLFSGQRAVLATVAQKGAGLIAEVKDYPAVKVFTLTERNRDDVIDQITRIFFGSSFFVK
jgi:nucleoside-triphosphatase